MRERNDSGGKEIIMDVGPRGTRITVVSEGVRGGQQRREEFKQVRVRRPLTDEDRRSKRIVRLCGVVGGVVGAAAIASDIHLLQTAKPETAVATIAAQGLALAVTFSKTEGLSLQAEEEADQNRAETITNRWRLKPVVLTSRRPEGRIRQPR